MASKTLTNLAGGLAKLHLGSYITRDPLMQCLAPTLSRSMATEAPLPPASFTLPQYTHPHEGTPLSSIPSILRPPPKAPDVLTTIYQFPTMEPLSFTHYPATHLALPLRRDILHRAVIFEADSTRQGTASTKWRADVHGSNRKIRPQKGTGRARLGNKKSPMLRGGGVAFGPHPRDFATKLPKKIYDLAWRTALSYRYRRGELVVVDDGLDVSMPEARWVRQILDRNRMGRAEGRSLIVTTDVRRNLWEAMAGAGECGRCKTATDVDVKDLLELGRVVIERGALEGIFRERVSDLDRSVARAVYE